MILLPILLKRAGLFAGDYMVTITDANGCTDIVAVNLATANGVIITNATVTPSTCGLNNGEATVFATGGQGGYTYSWSFNLALNSPTANNLSPDTYVVSVTDQDGCSDSTEIIVEDAGDLDLSILSFVNSVCENGTGVISLVLDGGLPPFTYSWSHDINATGANQDNLFAGAYSITVTDANNCQGLISQNIDLKKDRT